MKRFLIGLVVLMLLGGCAFRNAPPFLFQPKQAKMFDAEQALARGNEGAAVKLLEEIVEEKGDGVGGTDEALFRLSLLGIRQYRDPDGLKNVKNNLERLSAEYPSSIWTRLSWPLLEYVSDSEKTRNDLRNVKVRNSALSKENRELHLANQQIQALTKENRELLQRIEMLKSLDLELERKNRR